MYTIEMMQVQGYPTAQLWDYYLQEHKDYLEQQTKRAYTEVLLLLSTYYKVQDQYLGPASASECKSTASKIPLSLVKSNRLFCAQSIKEILKSCADADQLGNIGVGDFQALHKRVLGHIPNAMLKIAFDTNMPKFLKNMLAKVVSKFPYVKIVDPLPIEVPLLQYASGPVSQILIVAPFTDMHKNELMQYFQKKVHSEGLPSATTKYLMLEQYNSQILTHIFRSPASFDVIVNKGKLDTQRKFVSREKYNQLVYRSSQQLIGLVNFLFLLDAEYFNELPEMADYSDSHVSTVQPQAENPQQFHNQCLYYKCYCGKCKFLYSNEKYEPLSSKTLQLAQRKKCSLNQREFKRLKSVQFKFDGYCVKATEVSVNIANYELSQQNQRIQQFRQGNFSAVDIQAYSEQSPNSFDFRHFRNNYKEYVYSKYAGKQVDLMIKSEIMKLGIQEQYARKVEDQNGRKYELSELTREIRQHNFGEAEEAEEDFAFERQLFLQLTGREEEFAARVNMSQTLFRQLKTFVMRKIQLSGCCELDIIDLSHYLPFSLSLVRQFVELLRSEGEVPEYQRMNTAGPLSLPPQARGIKGQIVRTADEDLIEMNGVGEYQQVYSIFSGSVKRGRVEQIIREQPALQRLDGMCDDIMDYYAARYQ